MENRTLEVKGATIIPMHQPEEASDQPTDRVVSGAPSPPPPLLERAEQEQDTDIRNCGAVNQPSPC